MHTVDSKTLVVATGEFGADRTIIREAAQWAVRWHLAAGDEALGKALDGWRRRSNLHEQAWQQALRVSDRFALLSPSMAFNAMRGVSEASCQRAARSLTLLLTAPPGGAAERLNEDSRRLDGDYRTGTGEQQKVVLSDTTELLMNTRTRVSIRSNSDLRWVVLQRGELLISCGVDGAAGGNCARTILVGTRHGTLSLQRAQVLIRTGRQGTRVQVCEGSIEVAPAKGSRRITIQKGQQLSFNARLIGLPQPAEPGADAWKNGELFVRDVPLGSFLKELARYRAGALRCDSCLEHLRIDGVFQLNCTDQVLADLAERLSIRVRYRTPFWVTLLPPVR